MDRRGMGGQEGYGWRGGIWVTGKERPGSEIPKVAGIRKIFEKNFATFCGTLQQK